jgi:hypothetical protein
MNSAVFGTQAEPMDTSAAVLAHENAQQTKEAKQTQETKENKETKGTDEAKPVGKPTNQDPIAFVKWYILSGEPNSCFIKTSYIDFELSRREVKRSNGPPMRLLDLCMYRVDTSPVCLEKEKQGNSNKPETVQNHAIASHRRFLLIEHTLKELRNLKKQTMIPVIHGLVVYRMNHELLASSVVDESYTKVLLLLDAQKEADQTFYADVENKSLCFKI